MTDLIHRQLKDTLQEMLHLFPVLTLIGPRQSGKTTLCRELFTDLPYVNFEDISQLEEVRYDPKGFLRKYPNGLLIDEAQRFPDIFSYLQVAVDEDRFRGNDSRKFVISGSSNFSLMERVSQSMAGRTAVLTLLPLSTHEIIKAKGNVTTSELLFRGGYPAVWQIPARHVSTLISNYYATYVERDVRSLLNVRNINAFHTFIRLCASRIGSEFNASALSVETGVSSVVIKHWLSVLEASFIVYQLHPYYANIGKRLVKTPKIYFYDTGLAAFLLGVTDPAQLDFHPMRGALFENMVVNNMLKEGTNKGRAEQLYFYRDKSQHEVDVLRLDGLNIEAYEIKAGHTFMSDFFKNLAYIRPLFADKLTKTMVVYDGEQENLATPNSFCNFRSLRF